MQNGTDPEHFKKKKKYSVSKISDLKDTLEMKQKDVIDRVEAIADQGQEDCNDMMMVLRDKTNTNKTEFRITNRIISLRNIVTQALTSLLTQVLFSQSC